MKFIGKHAAVVVFGFCLTPVLQIQLPRSPSARPTPMSVKKLNTFSVVATDVPYFSTFGVPLCDGDGNLYFHVDPALNKFTPATIMRLSRDSNTPTTYELSADKGKELYFRMFSVTAGGKVWMLESKAGRYEAFGFDSDEKMPDDTHLDVPEHMEVQDFVVSQTGAMLLGGFFDEHAPKEMQGKAFLALFSPSGQLQRNLTNEGPEFVKLKEVRNKLHDGAGTTDEYGNFYFTIGSRVIVLTGYGDILREFSIQKPDDDATAAALFYGGNLISIEFVTDHKPPELEMKYLVLDSVSGQPYGLYAPSDELGNNNVCFSGRSGFTFLRIKDGRVQFLTAPLV
jgi:hypothetical protein